MTRLEHGNACSDGMADVLRILMIRSYENRTRRCPRCQSVSENPSERKGYANGFKPKTVDTRMGRMIVDVPQVSRASEILDEELDKWRNRRLGEYPYIILDAHYEKVRINGSVQSCAVFTAIGINTDANIQFVGTAARRNQSTDKSCKAVPE